MKIPHGLLVTLFIVSYHSPCLAQRVWQDSVPVTLPSENAGENDMRFRYLLPERYDETQSEKYPLLLFLHGAGRVGTDNEQQISTVRPEMLAQTDVNYPAIFVAPQIEQGPWNPYDREIDRTVDVLFHMIDEFEVDTNRLYVTGTSMGGFGTMTYLEYFNAYNPDALQFAAAAPSGGAWFNPDSVEALSDTPIWISHGALDNVVGVDAARTTFNALAGRDLDATISPDITAGFGPTSIEGTIRYTEYPDGMHGIWNRMYRSPDFYDWMFAQSLPVAVPEPTTGLLLLIATLTQMAVRRGTR
jgi:predicted peptidase